MCGIVGFWDISRQISNEKLPEIVQQMANAIVYRGPDSTGNWVDTDKGIALGHQRLAIVDLSPQGHQPMICNDDRYVIVFNGEVYNFLELRRELEFLGHNFRSHSDTEVMLASFSQWGVEAAVKRFNGMFAFAVWDCEERLLYLGRDRLGEKPLYYGWVGKTLLFASELKALKVHPDFQVEINRDALALFLRLGYIPAPHSIYQGIFKLSPGSLLCWDGVSDNPQAQVYWSAKEVAESGVKQQFQGNEFEAVIELEKLLLNAVKMRMIADVPLGAFLSGGIDSSTIVSLMQAQSNQAVKTFSIGFHEKAYDEAPYAKAVAKYLGTEHTEFYVTPESALDVIPKLPSLYDEPFSDPSQIPTFLVSQLAKQYVTVALSGDGGDELFGGYSRYLVTDNLWKKVNYIPQIIRNLTGQSLTATSPEIWNLCLNFVGNTLGNKLSSLSKLKNQGDKINQIGEVLKLSHPEPMYARLTSHWKNPEQIVIGSSEPTTAFTDRESWARVSSFLEHMMFVDTVTYLPDDILVKVDRANMGVSLEGRIPFLDHRVVEFAWQTPLSMKVSNGQGKWLLRELLRKYLPNNLIDRPKMGFSVPIDIWLRGPLREWAESLLDENLLISQGFLNPAPIRQKWKEHITGVREWHFYLWDVLMFQAWLQDNY
jgi:asparagine synthase (glutamine-hydrolysing)